MGGGLVEVALIVSNGAAPFGSGTALFVVVDAAEGEGGRRGREMYTMLLSDTKRPFQCSVLKMR